MTPIALIHKEGACPLVNTEVKPRRDLERLQLLKQRQRLEELIPIATCQGLHHPCGKYRKQGDAYVEILLPSRGPTTRALVTIHLGATMPPLTRDVALLLQDRFQANRAAKMASQMHLWDWAVAFANADVDWAIRTLIPQVVSVYSRQNIQRREQKT